MAPKRWNLTANFTLEVIGAAVMITLWRSIDENAANVSRERAASVFGGNATIKRHSKSVRIDCRFFQFFSTKYV